MVEWKEGKKKQRWLNGRKGKNHRLSEMAEWKEEKRNSQRWLNGRKEKKKNRLSEMAECKEGKKKQSVRDG